MTNELKRYDIHMRQTANGASWDTQESVNGFYVFHADALAAIETARPKWQDIESAPKDMGTYLFLCNKVVLQGFRDAVGQLCVCLEAGSGGYPQWRIMRRAPTHWMPLPAPPEK